MLVERDDAVIWEFLVRLSHCSQIRKVNVELAAARAKGTLSSLMARDPQPRCFAQAANLVGALAGPQLLQFGNQLAGIVLPARLGRWPFADPGGLAGWGSQTGERSLEEVGPFISAFMGRPVRVGSQESLSTKSSMCSRCR